MTNPKNYPSHSISFGEKQLDDRGREKIGRPIEVATVWPRTNGKQGGTIEWHIQPQSLGDGAWFMLDKERQQSQIESPEPDAFDQTETLNNRGKGLSR